MPEDRSGKYIPQSVHSSPLAHPAYRSVYNGNSFSGDKWFTHEGDDTPHLAPKLRISGDTPPVLVFHALHTASFTSYSSKNI